MKIRKLLRILLTIFGVGCGAVVSNMLYGVPMLHDFLDVRPKVYIFGIILSLLFGIIFFIFSGRIIDFFSTQMKKIQNLSLMDLLARSMGLILGLLIAFLVSSLVMQIPTIGFFISVPIYVIFGYLGLKLPARKQEEVGELFPIFRGKSNYKDHKRGIPFILDTSVIIDGRILDILKTGFLDGLIIIPEFVVLELQHIADSSDDLKRKKGRRGLDILDMLQNDEKLELKLESKNYKDMDVDAKLVKLAKHCKAKIVTNDFNLNKVAKVHRVEVLNINDLANAVKPIVLPGERIKVELIKSGKEHGQGIAYFDDGTMIVVEGGNNHVGKMIDVTVTSILQTSAGRMIFAKVGH